MKSLLQTTHKLDFLDALWTPNPNIHLFKIGTCYGQWYCRDKTYVILSVINDVQGNGHLNDVFEWFEYSAKRDGYGLMVQHVMNTSFYKHLVNKRGFVPHEEDSVIKTFTI